VEDIGVELEVLEGEVNQWRELGRTAVVEVATRAPLRRLEAF
jgi:hypothetical protein